MVTPNEFWLECHALATAYHNEGETGPGRLEAIVRQFEGMPPIAQQELLQELFPLVSNLAEIYDRCLKKQTSAVPKGTASAARMKAAEEVA